MGKVAKEHKLKRGGGSKHEKSKGHGSCRIDEHKKTKSRYNIKETACPAARSNSSKSPPSPQSLPFSTSVNSNDNKGRIPSKISNTKKLSDQQKHSKWESAEFQQKRSKSQSRQRSVEHAGVYNRDREREGHYRNGEREGLFDRKSDHGGAKISERREQHIGRNRSRDRVGQNRHNARRGGGVSDKRKSSTVHGDNRQERFNDNRWYGQRDRSHSRSPRRDRNNKTNRYRGRDDETQQKQYQRRDHQQRHEPKRRRYNNEGYDDKTYKWGKRSPSNVNDKKRRQDNYDKDNEPPAEKDKINFGLSGGLTEDTNKVNGVVVKYAEPPEARKPKRHWLLYPFKGETSLPTLHIHRQSCFLVGRDRKVVDLTVEHPSCSKQHAALQYRLVPFQRENGSKGKRVRLYVIDLESANGTFLNKQKIEARKYYELMERDVIKFGFSTREYVLLHENSKDEQEDDDVYVKDESEEKERAIVSS